MSGGPIGQSGRAWLKKKYVMTCEEVAEVLGISAQRVSQLQARALRKLRRGLLDRGYGPAEIDDLPGWLIAYWLELL